MKTSDILGMNERNLRYIRVYNKREDIRVVDDKLATKRLLKKTGIATPRVYGIIRRAKDAKFFDWDKLPINFVVKPNRGFGGEGVMVLKASKKKKEFLKYFISKRTWLKTDGGEVSFSDLRSHIYDIVDGRFSLSGIPDTAFFERRIILHSSMKKYTYEGIPDVRVIVFNKVPVMAMLRLPTRMSGGKANLAQGAVGVGIDVAMGVTTHAVLKMPLGREMKEHPDTGQKLIGFEIPFWKDILKMSVECQLASGLGFLGVDVAVDNKYGPEVLELNARPGLEIQNANMLGLAKRLQRVVGLDIKTVDRGVRIAKELFGEVLEKKERRSGRKILGSVEKVRILRRGGKSDFEVSAKIDTGAESSSIDTELARKLGYKDLLKLIKGYKLDPKLLDRQASKIARKVEKELKLISDDIVRVRFVRSAHGLALRPYIKMAFYLAGIKRISIVNIAKRGELKYSMIIGKRDIKGFLVNVGKR